MQSDSTRPRYASSVLQSCHFKWAVAGTTAPHRYITEVHQSSLRCSSFVTREILKCTREMLRRSHITTVNNHNHNRINSTVSLPTLWRLFNHQTLGERTHTAARQGNAMWEGGGRDGQLGTGKDLESRGTLLCAVFVVDVMTILLNMPPQSEPQPRAMPEKAIPITLRTPLIILDSTRTRRWHHACKQPD